jgi:hypothetical protein
MRQPPGFQSMGAQKKSDSSGSYRTLRARRPGKLGGRVGRQPPPVESHTSIVPHAVPNSHQRPAGRGAAADPGVRAANCPIPHHFQVVHPLEHPRCRAVPRNRSGRPHPETSVSACHPTVHIRLHHRRPPVSPAFGFACVHRTFQTGQSIALALRYGAPSLLCMGDRMACCAARRPPLLPRRDLSPRSFIGPGPEIMSEV